MKEKIKKICDKPIIVYTIYGITLLVFVYFLIELGRIGCQIGEAGLGLY